MERKYCISGNIREILIFREEDNFANLLHKIVLLKKNENSRILNFVESPKIENLNTRNYQIYSIQIAVQGLTLQHKLLCIFNTLLCGISINSIFSELLENAHQRQNTSLIHSYIIISDRRLQKQFSNGGSAVESAI